VNDVILLWRVLFSIFKISPEKSCYLYFCERYYMYFWKRHRCLNRYERVYIALCYNPHDYFQNFHNQGSMRLRFGIETKDHNVVPIFPPKHFVGTQSRVGEQTGYEATRNGRRPEATAQFVDVFGNVSQWLCERHSLLYCLSHKVTSRKLRLSTTANCRRECYSTMKWLIIMLMHPV